MSVEMQKLSPECQLPRDFHTRASHRKGLNHDLAYLILTTPRSYRKFKTNLAEQWIRCAAIKRLQGR